MILEQLKDSLKKSIILLYSNIKSSWVLYLFTCFLALIIFANSNHNKSRFRYFAEKKIGEFTKFLPLILLFVSAFKTVYLNDVLAQSPRIIDLQPGAQRKHGKHVYRTAFTLNMQPRQTNISIVCSRATTHASYLSRLFAATFSVCF